MSYIKVKEIYYDLLKYYPNLILSEEVCPATRLRQEALINSNENADLIIVVGDKMSNNTKMLKAIGKTHNKKKTILLETVEDLNKYDLSEFQNCIITSGASTPFAVVQEIINALKTYDKNTKYISKLNTKDYLKLKG
jgi:4-hydroxy-3-methylbut-2-enyl diphosphate reductase